MCELQRGDVRGKSNGFEVPAYIVSVEKDREREEGDDGLSNLSSTGFDFVVGCHS